MTIRVAESMQSDKLPAEVWEASLLEGGWVALVAAGLPA